MDPYKKTFETWDKVARLYQDKFMDLELYNESYDLFCDAIIKNNPRILEIGCGPGNITRYLLSKRPDFKIEATDIAPNMIELAKLNNPAVQFKILDSRDIEKLVSENKFDAIISGFCLPYLSETDILKFIKDCNSLLIDDGIIYISFVEGNPEQSGYKAASTGDITYFYYHSIDYISSLLIQYNFTVVHLISIKVKRKETTEETDTIIIAKKATTD